MGMQLAKDATGRDVRGNACLFRHGNRYMHGLHCLVQTSMRDVRLRAVHMCTLPCKPASLQCPLVGGSSS
jgi:hypothetical protein